VSIFIALLMLVIYWFVMSRTTYGYEIRVIGKNPRAAKYAGIPIGRNLIVTMALAGAVSGLAGAVHLMGQFPYQLIATTFSTDPTGFDAIGVALLGRTTAVGIFLGSLLFGGLRQGGLLMQLNANIPVDLAFIIQALVLFCIASEFLPMLRRLIPGRLGNHRPALALNRAGTSATEQAQAQATETSNGSEQATSVAVADKEETRSQQVEEK
jgi:simple sugar transport system permease protein